MPRRSVYSENQLQAESRNGQVKLELIMPRRSVYYLNQLQAVIRILKWETGLRHSLQIMNRVLSSLEITRWDRTLFYLILQRAVLKVK